MTTFTLVYRTDDKDPIVLEFDHSKVDWTDAQNRVREQFYPGQALPNPDLKYEALMKARSKRNGTTD